MIKYVCRRCGDLECETSVCPLCSARTEIKESKVFYCSHCNAPSFYETCPICGSSCGYVGTDLRPVFPEEKRLIEILLGEPDKFANLAVWNVGSNRYIIEGDKKIFSFTEFRMNNDPIEIIKKISEGASKSISKDRFFSVSDTIQNFIKINKCRLNEITNEAINYIKSQTVKTNEDEMFVSFSGGKDSTVTSDLVLKALDKKVIHIYGNTTLEYPTTEEYIKRFREKHPLVPMLVAKNKDQDFYNLCEVIGPPSRVMRWCCTVFKTGAITKKIDSTFKNSRSIISFQGIRRIESISRNKYEKESDESKIKKQFVVYPIIDWLDFDVWLYILSNQLDFNDAYKQGFARVGCWCCPNNSDWSEFLSSIYMKEKYNHFRKILYKFAAKIGKEDWKDYIDQGQWKKRQGGNGIEISKKSVISFKSCALEENTYNFELTKPISEELYKFFKPFGKISFDLGKKSLNEVYVLSRKTNMPLLKLSGRLGSSILKIQIVESPGFFANKKNAETLIKNQINKYQTCIGCTYCEAVCAYDAIKVYNRKKGDVSNDNIFYSIDENKCIGCLECVRHFSNGCYINKVLKIKKDDSE